MTTQKHLFVIDPLANLNLTFDTSLRLCRSLQQKGHRVFATESTKLAWSSHGGPAHAEVVELQFPGGDLKDLKTSAQGTASLRDFSGIHMRKDPPFDMDYIVTTWFLDSVSQATRIYNAPHALRSFNEKASLFLFPGETKPALLSSNPKELLAFIETKAQGDAVLKPLTLFGGRGVLRLSITSDKTSRAQIIETLERETEFGKSARLIQAFDPAIHDGEVRAFAVGGEPLAWCLKKPKQDSFLANTAAGAILSSYFPSPEEVAMVRRVSQKLTELGIFVVGFDIIGGHISEINITSPRLLVGPDDNRDYYAEMAEIVIRDCERFVP